MDRRAFLRVVSVAPLGPAVIACDRGRERVELPHRAATFPQGVASADPGPDSVVLWTRAVPRQGEPARFALWLELAEDEAFAQPVVKKVVMAEAAQDYTVHARLTGLQPDRVYYYRFVSGAGDLSMTGRTWTAPSPGAMQPLTLAFVSCQERKHGYYGAWRRMLKDDLAAEAEQRISFVLHLGDFIYETDEDWQAPLDEANEPIAGGLLEADGQPRGIGEFPDGGVSASGVRHARTLADYRHLYRRYLQDPDLLAARARWPFVCVWDDHEFSNDCWQTEANYDDDGPNASTDEPSQRRKVAANQAWSEYIPMDYTACGDSELAQAAQFRFVDVRDIPNDRPNEDNTLAIESLRIYRCLRFGGLVDLVLTDNRSYRSDHAIPESLSSGSPVFLHPRAAVPLGMLNLMDAGRTANGGSPPMFIGVSGFVFRNARRGSPPGSMLGAVQKQWWKAVMQDSRARWRLWGNSVPLMRLKVDLGHLDGLLPDVVVSSDAWDGYAHERRELMRFLRESNIDNVVSLAGDVHAHFAGLVKDDYDSAAGAVAAAELVTAAISSLSLFAGIERMSRRSNPSSLEAAVRRLIAYPDPDDPAKLVPNIDTTLRHGVRAGLAAADGASPDEVLALHDDSVNPHLIHADTSAHGYGVVTVWPDAIDARLVTVETIVDAARTDRVKSVVRMRIPHTAPGERMVIEKQV